MRTTMLSAATRSAMRPWSPTTRQQDMNAPGPDVNNSSTASVNGVEAFEELEASVGS
jgi:hypothetical protein